MGYKKINNRPIYEPIHSGDINGVKHLIKHGADLSAPCYQGRTPLGCALFAESHSIEIFNLLLDSGADANLRILDTSIFELAIMNDRADIVASILDRQVKFGIKLENQYGKAIYPLHEAARKSASKTINMLLKRGYDINTVDADGRTPLHAACRLNALKEKSEMIKLLLQAGADHEVLDALEQTPGDYMRPPTANSIHAKAYDDILREHVADQAVSRFDAGFSQARKPRSL